MDHLSEFGPSNAVGGLWECPSLFPLPLGGNESNVKWVLLAGINPGGPLFADESATQYIVGSFDGITFTPDLDSAFGPDSGKTNWLDLEPDYYAAATYNGLGDERVAIAWMNDWAYGPKIPASPWRSAMTVPRKLILEDIDGQLRLVSTPHPNVSKRENTTPLYCKQSNVAAGTIVLPIAGTQLDITLGFAAENSAKRIGLGVRTNGADNGTLIGYSFATKQMFVDRPSPGDNYTFSEDYQGVYHAPLKSQDGTVNIRVLLNWSSVEVFGGHGESTITAQIFPAVSNTALGLSLSTMVAQSANILPQSTLSHFYRTNSISKLRRYSTSTPSSLSGPWIVDLTAELIWMIVFMVLYCSPYSMLAMIENVNYSTLVTGVFSIFIAIWWFVGCKDYSGPMVLMKAADVYLSSILHPLQRIDGTIFPVRGPSSSLLIQVDDGVSPSIILAFNDERFSGSPIP